MYIYTHTHIHTHTHVCKFIHVCIYMYIHTQIHIYVYMHTYIYIHTYMHIYMYVHSAYAHPVASVNQKHLSSVHTCTCMVLNNTCKCMQTLRKNAYGLVHARLCDGAATSLLRTYLESCANIMQAVVCWSPSCRLDPTYALLPARPDRCRPPSCRLDLTDTLPARPARRCSF